MSKRKRGDRDQNAGEERHRKIRVQEVDNAAASAKSDGLIEPMQIAPAAQTQISKSETNDMNNKAARKKKKGRRKDLNQAEKVAKVSKNGVLAKQDGDAGESAAKVTGQDEHQARQRPAPESMEHDDTGKKLAGTITGGKDGRNTLIPRSQWNNIDPVGGQMLDLDPLFSHDEQHLLLAYGTFIAVFSTSSSLLLRRLQVSKSSIIRGLCLDPSNNDYLYVATLSGEISRWNWKEGQRTNMWQISSQIHALVAARQGPVAEKSGLIYTVDRKSGGPWLLSAHRLATDGENTLTEVKTLLKFEDRLTCFMVLIGGKAIVATSGQQLIIGTSDSPVPEKLNELQYVWRIVDCPEWIVSLDVRCRGSERTSRKHVSKGGMLEAIDVAIGGLKGAIHLYEDLLQKLLRKEKAGNVANLENIASRSLHWHRNAVLAVKWSLDGE